jgi:hypothetical protein
MQTSIEPAFAQEKTIGKVVDLDDPYQVAMWLPRLANDEIRAIRISKWRSPSECAGDADAMEKCVSGQYAQEPTLKKGGPTVYDYEGREDEAGLYFAEAAIWNSFMRKVLYPRITAADHLAVILNETHASGVIPERFINGHVPSLAVIRKFDAGSRAGPHVDRTDWDWPKNAQAAKAQTLFSALTYHRVADVGGELVLYGDKLNREEWIQAKLENSPYEIDRRYLNKKPVILTPKAGELIIFDAQRAHEVKLIVSGTRITESNFYVWHGEENPLGRYA